MEIAKKILFIPILIIGIFPESIAQPTCAEIPNTVMDGTHLNSHIPTKKGLSYSSVREADVIWSKRIWQTIDLREKANFHLYYPEEPLVNRRSLWDIIKCGIEQEQSLTPYELTADFDDQFNYPVLPPNGDFSDSTYQDKLTSLLYNVDYIYERDPETDEVIVDANGDFITKEVRTAITSSDIIEYKIKEDWFFDKQRSQRDVRIIGIAPVVYSYDSDGNIRAKKELFWLYFPQCRYVFQNYSIYNRQNDAQRMSFDDMFQKRMFTSYIHKESNPYDRSIFPTWQGLDALQESERIKNELFIFEHDLWHY